MKKQKQTVQPQNLPPIDKKQLMDKDGSFKLNPFYHNGKKYRVVGFTAEEFDEESGKWIKVDKVHIKCETTGSFQYQTVEKMKKFINL